jgi:hypothetical protein
MSLISVDMVFELIYYYITYPILLRDLQRLKVHLNLRRTKDRR